MTPFLELHRIEEPRVDPVSLADTNQHSHTYSPKQPCNFSPLYLLLHTREINLQTVAGGTRKVRVFKLHASVVMQRGRKVGVYTPNNIFHSFDSMSVSAKNS